MTKEERRMKTVALLNRHRARHEDVVRGPLMEYLQYIQSVVEEIEQLYEQPLDDCEPFLASRDPVT